MALSKGDQHFINIEDQQISQTSSNITKRILGLSRLTRYHQASSKILPKISLNRMLGLPRLRQLRVQNLSCEIHPDFQVKEKFTISLNGFLVPFLDYFLLQSRMPSGTVTTSILKKRLIRSLLVQE